MAYEGPTTEDSPDATNVPWPTGCIHTNRPEQGTNDKLYNQVDLFILAQRRFKFSINSEL